MFRKKVITGKKYNKKCVKNLPKKELRTPRKNEKNR